MRSKLGLANLFGLALQRDDGRCNVDGAAALMEALDLGVDERLGVAGLRLRSAMCEAATCLQVVDVVDKDAFELVHRRIDVARDGDVDEEHGPVAAAMHELPGRVRGGRWGAARRWS